MKKVLLASILGMLILTGCTSQQDAERALNAQGFTNVKITGYNMFDCSEDDFYHTGFTAKNAQGNLVSGTVCSGMVFKSATIRY
jgi:hypothetical protein